MRILTANIYSYAGNVNATSANEIFIADNELKQIIYFDFQKENNNAVTVTGTAGVDSSRQFVVKGMYADQPDKVWFENVYTLSSDRLLHHEGRTFDNTGKSVSKWFFALRRNIIWQANKFTCHHLCNG